MFQRSWRARAGVARARCFAGQRKSLAQAKSACPTSGEIAAGNSGTARRAVPLTMHLFELTRRLVDIDSTTGQEAEAAQFVEGYLRGLAPDTLVLEDAAPGRPNIFAAWGRPRVVLSTHLDTVPPFFPSSEDETTIHGRGSCDAKGIVASMIKAVEILRQEGLRDFGLLFLVGEERDST